MLFMIHATYTAEAWRTLVEKPQNRKDAISGLVKRRQVAVCASCTSPSARMTSCSSSRLRTRSPRPLSRWPGTSPGTSSRSRRPNS